MEVMAIAITVVVATANLHHLLVAKNNVPARENSSTTETTDLIFHIGLVPGVHVNILVNNH